MDSAKKRSLRIAGVTVSALLMAGLAACATPTVSESPEGGGAEMPTVRYGFYGATLDAGYLLMAQEKGFCEEQGVNVDFVAFKGAADIFPAFLSGQVDVIQANPSEALNAAVKGGELTFIGSTMPGLNYALYANEKFNSISDLSGAVIGSVTPTSLPTIVAQAMLLEEGVDPESVQLAKATTVADLYLGVANDLLDASASVTDYVERADADGVRVLGLARDVIPDYPRYALIANDAFLDAKPDGAVGLIACLTEGIRYALEHEDEANALTAKTLGGLEADDPSIVAAYRDFKEGGYLASNAEIPVKQMEYLAALQVKLGLAENSANVVDFVDDSYRRQAIERIGEVAPTYYGITNGQ